MRKEVLIAVILGLLFGSIITYGIYQANRTAKEVTTDTSSASGPKIGDVTPTPTALLTVISPVNGQVFATDSAVISGTVRPDTSVVILTELTEYLVTPETSGSFSQEIELTSGVNQIDITAINTVDGSRQDETLDIVYTTSL